MFLSIVTRHMLTRPGFFANHCASLAEQSDQNYEHVVIVDPNPNGSGMAWANRQFAVHAPRVTGDYVLLLDDDDVLATPSAIFEMHAEVDDDYPDILFFQVDHGAHLGILPDADHWQKPPQRGCIGGSAFIVRQPIWQRHIAAFSQPWMGDFSFLEDICRFPYRQKWLASVLVKCQRISFGARE